MTIRKTYGVNMSEYNTIVKIGKAHKRIEFVGGVKDGNGSRLAKYITEHPAVQAAIENDVRFKSGIITLINEVGFESKIDKEKGIEEIINAPEKDINVENKDDSSNGKEMEEILEIENFTQLKEFLADKIEFAKTISCKNLLNAALKEGYSFPNIPI